jgi:hypothetical protein
MSDQKIKSAAGKVPFNLIPMRALAGVARCFEGGAHIYQPGNYLLAEDKAEDIAARYGGAAQRHLSQLQRLDGLWTMLDAVDEDTDKTKGSFLYHLDHALSSLIMLSAILRDRGVLDEDPGMDNRIKEDLERHKPPKITYDPNGRITISGGNSLGYVGEGGEF